MRPSRDQILTRTTRSPSTRSWTTRSTASSAAAPPAQERELDRRLDDALARERRELARVAKRLVVAQAPEDEQRARSEHGEHRRALRARTARRAASPCSLRAYDQGPIVARTVPPAACDASVDNFGRSVEMRYVSGVIVGTVVAAALLLAPVAGAKDGDIRVAGTCSKASTSKLKLSGEDAGIEVEFEVDQNRNGVRWNVVLLRNGTQVAKRVRVTTRPERLVRGALRDREHAPGPIASWRGRRAPRARSVSPGPPSDGRSMLDRCARRTTTR